MFWSKGTVILAGVVREDLFEEATSVWWESAIFGYICRRRVQESPFTHFTGRGNWSPKNLIGLPKVSGISPSTHTLKLRHPTCFILSWPPVSIFPIINLWTESTQHFSPSHALSNIYEALLWNTWSKNSVNHCHLLSSRNTGCPYKCELQKNKE